MNVKWPNLKPFIDAGMTRQDLADKFGTTITAVNSALRRQGLRTLDTPTRNNNIEWPEELNQMIEDGMGVTEIAGLLGLKRDTVYREIRRRGLTAKNPVAKLTPEIKQKIEELIEDGWSLSDIADHVGVSKVTIYKKYAGRGCSPEESGRRSQMYRKMEEMNIEIRA